MEHGREHISPHAKKDLLPGKPKAVPALTGRGGGGRPDVRTRGEEN
jgi:hypothetical protein